MNKINYKDVLIYDIDKYHKNYLDIFSDSIIDAKPRLQPRRFQNCF